MLTPEQCDSITAKVSDTQELNTCQFYDLTILTRVSVTSTFAYIISNYDLVVHIIVYLFLQISNTSKEPIT